MLFLPVLLLVTNGYLTDDAISTRPLLKEQCAEFVKEYVTETNKKLPEGTKAVGLCVPIGDDIKAAPVAPTGRTGQDGSQTL